MESLKSVTEELMKNPFKHALVVAHLKRCRNELEYLSNHLQVEISDPDNNKVEKMYQELVKHYNMSYESLSISRKTEPELRVVTIVNGAIDACYIEANRVDIQLVRDYIITVLENLRSDIIGTGITKAEMKSRDYSKVSSCLNTAIHNLDIIIKPMWYIG